MMSLDIVKNSVQDQFNRNVHHYLQGSPMDDHELLSLIVRLAEPKADHHLLDVACGTGLHAGHLAEFYQVQGLDIAEDGAAAVRDDRLGLG